MEFSYINHIQTIFNFYAVINSIKRHDADPFAQHYKYIINKARKAEFAVYKKVKSLGHLPPGIKFFMFNSMVRPILSYGSDIWGVQ